MRSVAIFSVIAGHFFVLNTPFRDTHFEASTMFVQGWVYLLFNALGVPLFLMLTGYLNANKVTCDRKYYKGMVRVLVAYLLFSILTLLVRVYVLHEEYTLRNVIDSILRFNAIAYAWYIEMWIGLYLLTPFLNLLYKAIPTKRQKQVLIGTLFVMTALPAFTNRYNFHLIPGFWESMYPLLYFYIGTYIREYQPQMRGRWMALAVAGIMGVCALNPLFNALFVSGRPMVQIAGDSYGICGVIVAVLTFLLLYKCDIRSVWIKKGVARISLLSLDMYLCCYIFDRLLYPVFIDRYFVSQAQFGKFFFVVVPLVFVASLATAQLKEWVFGWFATKR